jgi:hypothetical protein
VRTTVCRGPKPPTETHRQIRVGEYHLVIVVRKVVRSLMAAMPGWLIVIFGVCLAIPLARLVVLVLTAALCLMQTAESVVRRARGRAASPTGAATKALPALWSAARLGEMGNRGPTRRLPRLDSHGDESPFQVSWSIAGAAVKTCGWVEFTRSAGVRCHTRRARPASLGAGR